MEATKLGSSVVCSAEGVLAPADTALDRAKAAIGARDEILAAVSHDLRSPLTAINSAREILWRELSDVTPVEGRRLRRHLDMIGRCTARMTRLANDLLDLLSIESGRLSVSPDASDIREAIEETLECFEGQAKQAQIRLEAEVDPSLPEARFDKDRLLQVLANLVANSLRFTMPGGSVQLLVRRIESGVLVSVRDTGKGMPPSTLERIFDRQWQLTRRDGTGHGLGLAISKAIVEAHGGTIFAESVLGTGTTVSFTLPAFVAERSMPCSPLIASPCGMHAAE